MLVDASGKYGAIPKYRPRPSTPSYSSAQKKAQKKQQQAVNNMINEATRIQQQLQDQVAGQAAAYQRQLQQRAQATQNQYMSKLDQLLASYNPVNIPVFPASYYRPNQTLAQINHVYNQKPKVNNKQLKQIAQQQVNLLTNPQIEMLRSQINELGKLTPKIRKQILSDYTKAQQQLGQNTQNMIAQITQSTAQQADLRPGVAAAISAQAQKDAHPLAQLLSQSQNDDLDAVIGSLETQKENAQALMHSIQKNKKSMTKVQYNALHDQAIQQFKQAQQAQLQLLQQIAEIEAGARKNAADDLQQRAQVKNQTAQQLFGIKSDLLNTWNQSQQQALQNLFQNDQAKLNALQQQNAAAFNAYQQKAQADLQQKQQQIQQQLQNAYSNSLSQWQDYLTGPTVQTGADAMKRLRQNQAEIEQAIGKNGYLQLWNQLSRMNPNAVNPRYDSSPAYIVHNGGLGSAPSPRASSGGSGNFWENAANTFGRSMLQGMFPGASLGASLLRKLF